MPASASSRAVAPTPCARTLSRHTLVAGTPWRASASTNSGVVICGGSVTWWIERRFGSSMMSPGGTPPPSVGAAPAGQVERDAGAEAALRARDPRDHRRDLVDQQEAAHRDLGLR